SATDSATDGTSALTTAPIDCAGLSVCADECADLSIDHDHCGGCFKQCPSDQVCTSGACVSPCGEGTSLCDGACVDLYNDAANCGHCGLACPPPAAHGEARCVGAGNCGFACDPWHAPDREVMPTTCAPCSVDALLVLEPVYLWRFDEEQGDALVESITDVPGTYSAATLGLEGVTAPDDLAAGFLAEDANALVELASVPQDAFTLEVVARIDDLTPPHHALFSLVNDITANELLLIFEREETEAPGLRVIVADHEAVTDVTLPVGEWVHVAVTWSSVGKLRVYLNGVRRYLGAGFAPGMQLQPGTLAFGQEQDVPGGGFDPSQRLGGALDTVALYARQLDELEIAAHTTALLCGL
ncbi:MAG: hypothetical protein KC468_19985, partial [Myxococcales bacterium]|nr:hypothetical protein [Myxococcales bacterium]